MSLGF